MNLKRIAISLSFVTLLIYGGLLISAFYFFDVSTLKSVASKDKIFHAVWVSVSAASIATVFAVLLAVPGGYALSRYHFRFKKGVDLMLELPMIVSPAAIGALLLIFFQTPAGLYFRNHVVDVVYTFSGIVLAQLVTVLGIATRMIKSVFDEIPVRYEQIARTLGASPNRAFLKISLPLAKNGILYAVILTWAKAIGEFGATITLAGAMPMKTETLPTAIYMSLSSADIAGAVIVILMLFSISMFVLAATRYFLSENKRDDRN